MSYAEIDFLDEVNSNGNMQNCVFATCNESGDVVGPIWGHGPASVKRALAQLSETCSCGNSYHKAADEEDEED
jgi:hypothetical protein